jgi:hypothetical protein
MSAVLATAAGAALVSALGVGLWRGASRIGFGVGVGDQAIAVRSAAGEWGTRAVAHFGWSLRGPLRCATPVAAPDRGREAFRVSCRAVTRSSESVRLVGTLAGVAAGGNGQYLTGPWVLRVGAATRPLGCLPARWSPAHPCPSG